MERLPWANRTQLLDIWNNRGIWLQWPCQPVQLMTSVDALKNEIWKEKDRQKRRVVGSLFIRAKNTATMEQRPIAVLLPSKTPNYRRKNLEFSINEKANVCFNPLNIQSHWDLSKCWFDHTMKTMVFFPRHKNVLHW